MIWREITTLSYYENIYMTLKMNFLSHINVINLLISDYDKFINFDATII